MLFFKKKKERKEIHNISLNKTIHDGVTNFDLKI